MKVPENGIIKIKMLGFEFSQDGVKELDLNDKEAVLKHLKYVHSDRIRYMLKCQELQKELDRINMLLTSSEKIAEEE